MNELKAIDITLEEMLHGISTQLRSEVRKAVETVRAEGGSHRIFLDFTIQEDDEGQVQVEASFQQTESSWVKLLAQCPRTHQDDRRAPDGLPRVPQQRWPKGE